MPKIRQISTLRSSIGNRKRTKFYSQYYNEANKTRLRLFNKIQVLLARGAKNVKIKAKKSNLNNFKRFSIKVMLKSAKAVKNKLINNKHVFKQVKFPVPFICSKRGKQVRKSHYTSKSWRNKPIYDKKWIKNFLPASLTKRSEKTKFFFRLPNNFLTKISQKKTSPKIKAFVSSQQKNENKLKAYILDKKIKFRTNVKAKNIHPFHVKILFFTRKKKQQKRFKKRKIKPSKELLDTLKKQANFVQRY